jgi:hypothetical protein
MPGRRTRAVRPIAALAAVVAVVVAACGYQVDAAVLVEQRTLTDATELSGIVASTRHPGWYWAIRDVWKQEADPSRGVEALPAGTSPDPVPAWCPPADTATATGRNRCRQVERSSLYAVRFDATGTVVQVRRIGPADEAWATEAWRLQNNDWEEVALSPDRPDHGGAGLLIGATGDGTKNPARAFDEPSATWVDVQCRTRRLIEVAEPDPATATTWSPRRIFDLADYSSNGTNCNSEAMFGTDEVSPRGVWIAKRTTRTVWTRSLAWEAGRDPATTAVPPVPGHPAAPEATAAGIVSRLPAGPLLTGAAVNPLGGSGRQVVLVTSSLDVTASRCQAWSIGDGAVSDPVALLTSPGHAQPLAFKPATANCKGGIEGVAFEPAFGSPPTLLPSLFMIRDTGTAGVLGVRLPWEDPEPQP